MLFPVKIDGMLFWSVITDSNGTSVPIEELVDHANGMSQCMKELFEEIRELKTAKREIEVLGEQLVGLRVENETYKQRIESLEKEN